MSKIWNKEELNTIRDNSTKAMSISTKVLAFGACAAIAGAVTSPESPLNSIRIPLMKGSCIMALLGLGGVIISSRIPNISRHINDRRIMRKINSSPVLQ